VPPISDKFNLKHSETHPLIYLFGPPSSVTLSRARISVCEVRSLVVKGKHYSDHLRRQVVCLSHHSVEDVNFTRMS
jgi:hypothetical protein